MPKKDKPVDAPAVADEKLVSDNPTAVKPAVVPETEDENQFGVEVEPSDVVATEPSGNRFKRLWQAYLRRKKWTIPLTVVVLLGLVVAIPLSRYPILALWMKRDVQIEVTDDGTKKPVASAKVNLDGQMTTTDNQGKAQVKAKVGQHHLTVSKKYYADADGDVFVGVGGQARARVTIKATGRQVPLKVVNKLTGKPIENALIKAAETEVKTDKDGKAVLVLPAGKTTLPVEVSSDKFNAVKTNLAVTESEVPANSFQLTPTGTVYFLSKKSGNIDVVKTDLDGGNRETIVAGTGRELDGGTVLLASRDWHYLALLSRRDSDQAKLYLIDTKTDKMTTMDEGNVVFDLVGWSNDVFVYKVTRNNVNYYQSNRVALKSYETATGKINVLDQSEAGGDQYSYVSRDLNAPYLVGDRVVYATPWSGTDSMLAGKANVIRSILATGKDKKDIKTFASDKYHNLDARLYEPQGVYFATYNVGTQKQEYYAYEAGAVKPAQLDSSENFYSKVYPTFLQSPSGSRYFWSELRDGRNALFVGNDEKTDAKQIADFEDYQTYGWYTDDYLLVSKKGSELYIMPVGGGTLTKITDYHKPEITFYGYGGGYGGF